MLLLQFAGFNFRNRKRLKIFLSHFYCTPCKLLNIKIYDEIKVLKCLRASSKCLRVLIIPSNNESMVSLFIWVWQDESIKKLVGCLFKGAIRWNTTCFSFKFDELDSSPKTQSFLDSPVCTLLLELNRKWITCNLLSNEMHFSETITIVN